MNYFNCLVLGFTFFVLAASSVSCQCCESYCLAKDPNPAIDFGTKSAYKLIHGDLVNQTKIPGCQPIQIWSANRHGTRFSKDSDTKNYQTTGSRLQAEIVDNYEKKKSYPITGALCDEDYENLKAWQWNVNVTTSKSEWLSDQGWSDLKNIAKRFQKVYPKLLSSSYNDTEFNFYYGDVERLQASMQAYMDGLFDYIPGPSPNQIDNLTIVQPYKTCPDYETNSKNLDKNSSESNQFIFTTEYQKMIHDVSVRLGFNNSDLSSDDIETMYEICGYEKAWNPKNISAWCAVFTPEQLPLLEYQYDLDSYYKTGYGYNRSADFGCIYVSEMLKYFRNNKDNNQPKAIAYFTHAEMVQMFLVALDVEKDSHTWTAKNYDQATNRKWRTSLISPFATNLAAIFYQCETNEDKVLLFLNEKRLEIDGCDNGLCDWNEFYNRYNSMAQNCNQDFCSNDNLSKYIYRL